VTHPQQRFRLRGGHWDCTVALTLLTAVGADWAQTNSNLIGFRTFRPSRLALPQQGSS